MSVFYKLTSRRFSSSRSGRRCCSRCCLGSRCGGWRRRSCRRLHCQDESKIICRNDDCTNNNKIMKLENVAIVNALQLEAARATPALFAFNFDAMRSLKSLNLLIVYYSVFTADLTLQP